MSPPTDDDDPFGPAALGEPQAPKPPAVRHSLRELAAAGLTDAEIAAATGLPLATVQASPDVLVPLGEAHDARVARAVYQAAVGGETWTEKLDKFGEVQRLREYVMPDTRAAAFYLENRQRQAWGGTVKETVRVVVARDVGRLRDATIYDASDELENFPSPGSDAR